MKPPSFRLKIALLSTVISGTVLVGFGTAALVLIARQKTAGLDTEIRALGTRLPGWVANRRDFVRLEENLGFIFGEARRDQVILGVRDANGTWLYTSPGWPAGLDPASLGATLADDPEVARQHAARDCGEGESGGGRGQGGMGLGLGPGGGGGMAVFTKVPVFRTVASGGDRWRVGMLGTATTTLAIGLNASRTQAETAHLRNGFLLALPLALSLVALGGWLVAGRALRPLRSIASTAEQVTARGLDQRIPLAGDDPEIARVIRVLNRMMDRLEQSFHQATRFSADASHELNTPLAIMQGALENALQEAVPDSREQRVFGELLEETQRLKTITRGLLLLARADAGQLKPLLAAVGLSEMLDQLTDDFRVVAGEMGLEFEVALVPGIRVAADEALLRTAVLNLLVNAAKYNEPGGRIRVLLEARQGTAVLEIGNSGPGIPIADQALVFTRFHRVDAARQRQVEGIGLGLSLALEIVRAHGGELVLRDSRPGWTCFALSVPQATLPSGG